MTEHEIERVTQYAQFHVIRCSCGDDMIGNDVLDAHRQFEQHVIAKHLEGIGQ